MGIEFEVKELLGVCSLGSRTSSHQLLPNALRILTALEVSLVKASSGEVSDCSEESGTQKLDATTGPVSWMCVRPQWTPWSFQVYECRLAHPSCCLSWLEKQV